MRGPRSWRARELVPYHAPRVAPAVSVVDAALELGLAFTLALLLAGGLGLVGRKRSLAALHASLHLLLLLHGVAVFVPTAQAAGMEAHRGRPHGSFAAEAPSAPHTPNDGGFAADRVVTTSWAERGRHLSSCPPSSCVQVGTFGELETELAGTKTVIQLAAGTYAVSSTLTIDRDVTLMADVEGSSVILDGGGVRRVIKIEGGTVQLVGLDISNGYAYDVSGQSPIDPMGLLLTRCS